MKNMKKSNNYEATIAGVLDAVQTGFAKVEDRFDRLETGFDRHEGILKTLVEGQDHLREDIHILDQRVSKTQNRIEDVVDEHQDSLREYGRRITLLERAKP